MNQILQEDRNTPALPEPALCQADDILHFFRGMQNAAEEGIVESIADLGFPDGKKLKPRDMCFYQIKQLSFDKEYPHREAFENVLSSFNNRAYNFVYVLTGTSSGINICIGVVKNRNRNEAAAGKQSLPEQLSAVDYGKIVASLFEGNFSGSELKKLSGDTLTGKLCQSAEEYTSGGILMGIPSVQGEDSKQASEFQGIDRLINSMMGLEWRLVVVCEPVSKQEIQNVLDNVYGLYNKLSIYAKQTMQSSVNTSRNSSSDTSISDSHGENVGYSSTDGSSTDRRHGNSGGSGTSHQENRSEGKSWEHSESHSTSIGSNEGQSQAITVEIANKHAQELMKYIDEELLERLKTGFSRGMFKTSVYYMAKSPTQANRLKSGIISLFQGSKSTYSPLRAQRLPLDEHSENQYVLRVYQNQFTHFADSSMDVQLLTGVPFEEGLTGLQTYLTAGEVSLLTGLPQKEVPGLPMKEAISFGLNVKAPTDEANAIELGPMMQRGRELTGNVFQLPVDSLMKHVFITGVTGSGKTTTCHKLLSSTDIPFLVIEPAKTEYRTLINRDPDLIVLTLGNESVAPLRLNPFELVEGEVISGHIDMIKAAFTSAYQMEASMPQIMEESIYQCYEKRGWDTNQVYQGQDDLTGGAAARGFPTLSDLLEELKEVVKSKGFGDRMQSDYIGSLVSRLSNLTKGAKGRMLNCEKSTDFRYILQNRVVLELEELRNSEDKALVMGFILSRLSAIIRQEHKKNPGFRHLTLVEEAHRLLSKADYGDSGAKRAAVEAFTDLLAEVRKYGEGLIIVDQIPNKLAPEVLKNTNTKIVHKLFARDDKEAIGDTMLMDDKQKEYLSALRVGEAIIFSEQTDLPVHIKVKAVTDTNEAEIKDEVVAGRFQEKRHELGECYQYLDLERKPALYAAFEKAAAGLRKMEIDGQLREELLNLVEEGAREYGKDVRDIWSLLVGWKNWRSGKRQASIENWEEREKELTDFFAETYSKPDFSEEDLSDSNWAKLYTYLS